MNRSGVATRDRITGEIPDAGFAELIENSRTIRGDRQGKQLQAMNYPRP